MLHKLVKLSWNDLTWNVTEIFEYKGRLRAKLEYKLGLFVVRSSAYIDDVVCV